MMADREIQMAKKTIEILSFENELVDIFL